MFNWLVFYSIASHGIYNNGDKHLWMINEFGILIPWPACITFTPAYLQLQLRPGTLLTLNFYYTNPIMSPFPLSICRFEKKEMHNQPSGYFVPFGDGPRNCIGFKLARLQMKIVLTALLRKNKFIKTSATKPLLMTCLSITACPDYDVLLSLQTRLP